MVFDIDRKIEDAILVWTYNMTNEMAWRTIRRSWDYTVFKCRSVEAFPIKISGLCLWEKKFLLWTMYIWFQHIHKSWKTIFIVANNCDTLQLTVRLVHATWVFDHVHSRPVSEHSKSHLMCFSQPFVYELKLLYEHCVLTHDVLCKEIFQMRAVIIWTTSDFLTYDMLFG